MKGWLGKYQDMGVAIYLTPDGKTRDLRLYV